MPTNKQRGYIMEESADMSFEEDEGIELVTQNLLIPP